MTGMEKEIALLSQFAEEDQEYIRALRRQFHRHPELSFQEFETTRTLAEELQKCPGMEVTTWDGKTGVLGVLRGEKAGKVVALRADIDALPLEEKSGLPFPSEQSGAAHCCGHDLHMSVLIGVARVLSHHPELFSGTVKFIFQPGEEKLGGSETMIERGVLKNPDAQAIFAMHTWPAVDAGSVGFRAGAFMASSDDIDLRIIGKSGHAAHPDQCADPIVASAAVISGLQTIVSREIKPTDSTVLTISMIQGGKARNVIAPDVTLKGTVRTISNAVRDKMPAMIQDLAGTIAKSYHCEAEVNYTKGVAAVINEEGLNNLAKKAAAEVLGAEKTVDLKEVSLGSEDFSAYQQEIPGVLFRLGTGSEDPQTRLGLHNSAIRFDEKALLAGVKALSAVALAYLDA